jgi:hypothetical protein
MNSKRKKIGLNRKQDAFASVESRSLGAPSTTPTSTPACSTSLMPMTTWIC